MHEVTLYKYAALYKRAQLIKVCNYILYEKQKRLYGPRVANILFEKRAAVLGGGGAIGNMISGPAVKGLGGKIMQYGGAAFGLAFPIMGAWGGGKAGYQIGDWAANKLGWDPNGFGSNLLRWGGAAAGAVGGWYLGRGFGAIGRGIGGFAKGALGIKGNNSRIANFLFGGTGATLGMGGLTGMMLAGKPQEWLEGAGTMAQNSSYGMGYSRRAKQQIDAQLANYSSNRPTNFTSRSYYSAPSGDSTTPAMRTS